MWRRAAASLWWQAVLVLGVCAALYWPKLGSVGLGMTEGHRVIPAWTMLDSGDWLRLEMFGAPYLRKPPGMPWAIAAVSGVLGETEFAARAVSAASATVMGLVALAFARRWFGREWGLAAGLAQALIPWLWPAARSAEIEMLNLLATQVAGLTIVDILAPPRSAHAAETQRGWRMQAWQAIVLALAATGVVVAKGPASAPALGAAVAASCLARRAVRPLRTPALWLGFIGAAGVGALALWPFAHSAAEPGAVSEDVGKFLWDTRHLRDIALLPLWAFVWSMPASLSLIFPWGPGRKEGSSTDGRAPARPAVIARALALGWVLAVATYTVVGVSKLRYAMPAVVFLPPLAAWVVREWRGAGESFGPVDRSHARWAMLGHWAVWPVVMLAAAAIWLPDWERRRAQTSGREAGLALAEKIEPGTEVWADGLVEARPEVLLYAQRAARAAGRAFVPRWVKPRVAAGELPAPGSYLLLRTDESEGPVSNELRVYASHLAAARIAEVATGGVYPDRQGQYKFRFALFRVVSDEGARRLVDSRNDSRP